MDGCYTVFARAAHPILERPKASPKELASYPWVILADDPVSSSWIGAYFEAHGLAPPLIPVETTTLGSLSILWYSDYLATFASESEETIRAFGLHRVNHEGTFWEYPAGIARRRAGRPSPAPSSDWFMKGWARGDLGHNFQAWQDVACVCIHSALQPLMKTLSPVFRNRTNLINFQIIRSSVNIHTKFTSSIQPNRMFRRLKFNEAELHLHHG